MFGMLNHLARATVGVVVTPVAVVADVVTLGGVTTDQKQSYTTSQLEAVLKNLRKATR